HRQQRQQYRSAGQRYQAIERDETAAAPTVAPDAILPPSSSPEGHPMRKLTLSAVAAALVALSLIPDSAQAQPARVFVSAQGADANPCTFAQPCRTFQRAYNAVAAAGEIDVLDPAGYGPVFISKSISIQGHGFAGISVSNPGSGGIVISGGDVVNLKGLIVERNGVGGFGILFQGATKLLTVENCVIRAVTQRGLELDPTTSMDLVISNTLVAGTGVQNIFLAPSGTGLAVKATFNRVEAYAGGVSG